jgi:hypothetical protein
MSVEHKHPDCAGGWTQVWGIRNRAPYWVCPECRAWYPYTRATTGAVVKEFDLIQSMEALAERGAELLDEREL